MPDRPGPRRRGHVENSTSRHLPVWLDGLETALLATEAGETVPPAACACLARMGRFAHALLRPDGRLPLLNDSVEDEPVPVQALFDLEAAVQPRDADATLADSPPAVPGSGYAVLRSGPGPLDTYLLFDAGGLGPAYCPGHGHADTLGFELWGHGETLIIDPGTYQYPAGPWRDYFCGTAAHSTATVDGLDQSTFAGPFRVADMARGRLLAADPGPGEHAVAGEHDGYTRLPGPVVHRRRIRLRGRGELMVEDTFLGHEEHRLVLRFHLAPCQVLLEGT